MRTVTAAILATTMLVSGALADTTAPLAPGKPAGVHKADLGTTGLTLLAFGALIGVGFALLSSSTQSSGGNTPTVISTTTAP